MASKLTFADVPFALDDPTVNTWVEANISFSFLQEIQPVPHWPGRRLAGIAAPQWPPRPPLRLGDLWMPTGATRWAEFHALASTEQMQDMLSATAGEGEGPVPGTLTIQTDLSETITTLPGSVSTQMYMLPPRPLANHAGGVSGLWLITLVDERYYFPWKPAEEIGGQESWSELLNELATALGITLTHDEIDSVYGDPAEDSPLWSQYENAAILLDAAAWNVGCAVVRTGHNTYELKSWQDSIDDIATNRGASFKRSAGGHLLDEVEAGSSEELQQAGQRRAADAILPKSVTVTFPKFTPGIGFHDERTEPFWIRQSYGAVWAKEVSLTDLSPPFSNQQGTAETIVFHDTARAIFDMEEDTDPSNMEELEDLAEQIAIDYYSAQLGGIDEVYPGIREWPPEGISDVLYAYRGGGAFTRVMRKPWNFAVTDLQHSFFF